MTKNIIISIREHEWKDRWIDFSVSSYQAGRLVIAGGNHAAEHHSIEIIAENPLYIKGAFAWTCDSAEDFIRTSMGLSLDGQREVKKLDFYVGNMQAFSVTADNFFINAYVSLYNKMEYIEVNKRLKFLFD